MIKINTLHSKLSKALKEPKSALDYLFRMRKLSTFLPELPDLKNKERLKIKKFFEEASEVRAEVEAVFNPSASACRTPDLEVRLLPPSVIYSVVRATKPEIVVETGVNNGISTYFILSALERNDSGLLYSIDIKEKIVSNRFKEEKEIGWLVPEELKRRWTFLLGDSKEVLPRILAEVKIVDIFMLDSGDTYEHKCFEFRTAWRHLREGGVLLSDDIFLNKAFEDFIKEVKPSRTATFSLLGLLRK